MRPLRGADAGRARAGSAECPDSGPGPVVWGLADRTFRSGVMCWARGGIYIPRGEWFHCLTCVLLTLHIVPGRNLYTRRVSFIAYDICSTYFAHRGMA